MKEIIDSILTKYGIWALVIAVLLLWALAHWTAAPGKSVSVLWGLVEYTKSTARTHGPATVEEKTPAIVEEKTPAIVEEKTPAIVEERTPAIVEEKTKGISINSSHEIIPVQSEDRIYINKRPKELIQNISQLTGIQAYNFVDQNYAGKWLRIHGPVDSLIGFAEGAALFFRFDGIDLTISMKNKYVPQLSHLNEGDVVTVDGMISLISVHDHIGLIEGELVVIE